MQRGPDPGLQLLTALTAGGDADAASPFAVADSADVVDTPTGRAVALSGAITSGQAELVRRQQEEARLRQEVNRRVRAVPGPARSVATVGRGRLGRPLSGAGWYGGYGNYTCIDHGRPDGQRLSTCYGHQSRLRVSPGQRVRAGQVVGLVGSTGASTGPHLHFEARLGDSPVDPLPWI
ncbi:M23 family metallopeptidase [Micromonospora sp. NPDC047548]|uniref:M23 family metallopeptidase n=1 Tax=Micromonospora sp. NPDC047548 TaxID=3155624 RepID=UPI0033F3F614